MTKRSVTQLILNGVILGLFAFSAHAESSDSDEHAKHHPNASPKASMMKEPSPEMRKKMADAHQKMADCLKSDRPMSECKQEMMKECHQMMKDKGHCPMMGDMGDMMGHGAAKGDHATSGASHEEHHED